ncbi:MAG: hypothetical protein ABII74_07350 [Elusimicrobiota bacterium]
MFFLCFFFSGCLNYLDVSPDGKQIVYMQFRDGDAENENALFIINSDGTKKKEVLSSKNLAHNLFPAFSSDGSRIAYIKLESYGKKAQSDGENGPELWVMKKDGSDNQKLASLFKALSIDWRTEEGFYFIFLSYFRWSPDGKKIVYHYLEQIGRQEWEGSICLVDVKSKKIEHLTSEKDKSCTYPTFSSNGKKITYISGITDLNRGFYGDLWITDVDGKNKKKIIIDSSESENGSFMGPVVLSPDGKKIAFSYVQADEKNQRIWVADADGGNARPVSENGSWVNPQWSPNGRMLIWEVAGGHMPNYKVGIVDLETNWTKIFEGISSPKWFPDSKRIAYSDTENKNLCVSNIDGSENKVLVKSK